MLVNPAIQLGEPCIARTRIQTWVIQSRFEDGETAEELQADFSDVSLAAVHAALSFERRLARAAD
ncbi:DUF433 domain-containing protein [Conexibacter arvalis]|uniref:Uncharacterized protein (DUF433 family) n=1 Tax=Conexibacter arvalis TaxID=912552 RepID=A0A840ILW2_9ACTN|nr:uncharacterized protein (DUF433 family) [Conexibacter arvalis]